MKTKEKRKQKALIKFPVDLQDFAKCPISKAKRFIQITGDINMRDEKDEEENIPNPFQAQFRRRTQS